jgi:ABC-type lipoprotein export system ATPase subunit
MVTHDPNMAAYAHRVIRLLDGMVDRDEQNGEDH